MIPFMEIKESDIKLSVQINIVAATAFAQQAVGAFMSPMYVSKYITSFAIAVNLLTDLPSSTDPVTSSQVELFFLQELLQPGGEQTPSALSQLENMVYALSVRYKLLFCSSS